MDINCKSKNNNFNLLELFHVCLKIQDPAAICSFLSLSRGSLLYFFDQNHWKKIIVLKFPVLKFLYINLPLTSIDWYCEAKLLYRISNSSQTENLKYFITPNYFYEIENREMRRNFIARADSILSKWTICGSGFSVSDFDFTDSWLLYNVNSLEWIMKFSQHENYYCYNADNIFPQMLSEEVSDNTSEFLRSYMVIPSYLIFYRLIVLFGHISNEFSLFRDLWEFGLVHNKSQIKMRIHDYRAGFRFSFLQETLNDKEFRNDLLEFINFLTLPFWLKPIVPQIIFGEYQFRSRIMKSNKLFFSIIRFIINKVPSTNYKEYIIKYLETISDNESFFSLPTSPFLTTADFYCSQNNYRMDEDQIRRFQEPIYSKWHMSERESTHYRPIQLHKLKNDWHIFLDRKESCEKYISIISLRIYDENIQSYYSQLMPSSLFLYKILCLFPAALNFINSASHIWKIVIAHSQSGQLVQFCDQNGRVDIVATYNYIPNEDYFINDYPEFYPTSISEKLFFSDLNILLNILIGDSIMHPCGIPAGFVA